MARTTSADPTGSVAERVHAAVRAVPEGYVTTYGDLARSLGLKTPRQVGAVLAASEGSLPWHRVVHADGTFSPHLADEQARRLREEGVAVTGNRVALAAVRW
jgi:alkylated DNA nucleotide flippase Atl1